MVWDLKWEFALENSIQGLEQQNISITLFHKKKPYYKTSLNLLEVAKGPVHHSISLPKTSSRLSFDLEFFQTTTVKVKPQKVECFLDYPSDCIFSLTLTLMSKKKLEPQHTAFSEEPVWNFSEKKELEIPTLEFPATIRDIRASSLNVKLWVQQNSQWKVAGQTWVTLPKLLSEDKYDVYKSETEYFHINSTSRNLENPGVLNKSLHSDLWRKGKRVGTINGSFSVMNLPFLHQMITGVNTEGGYELQSMSVMLNRKKVNLKRKVELPYEMSELCEHTKKLKEFINKKFTNTLNYTPYLDSGEFESHVKNLADINRLLQLSSMDSMVCFTYKHLTDLVRAQEILLDLAEHLCAYCDYIVYDVRPYYFECLTHLIKRGELDLGNLKINPNNKLTFESKLRIALRYRKLLTVMLRFALPKMNIKGADYRVYNFIESFCVRAYFRIPGFRERLLASIKKKMWTDLEEWRGVEMNLENENNSTDKFPMLNWCSLFYAYLPNNEEHKEVLSLLNEKTWQEVMAKRSGAFFRFTYEWANHVNNQFVNKDIPWKDIPGYTIILKSMLLELKNRNILFYPELMIKASCGLLKNTNILNTYVTVVFQKADLYRYKTVRECFNVLSAWFSSLWVDHKELPEAFDLDFLIKGIKLALSHEISYNVCSALTFVYNHYHMLPSKIREKVIRDYLLQENFEEYLFHWSYNVRYVFMHLLFFRIKSLKHFSLETDEFSALDQEIDSILKVRLESIQCNSKPYSSLAVEELKVLQENYRTFMEEVAKSSRSELPYPKIKVDVRGDQSEKLIDEDW